MTKLKAAFSPLERGDFRRFAFEIVRAHLQQQGRRFEPGEAGWWARDGIDELEGPAFIVASRDPSASDATYWRFYAGEQEAKYLVIVALDKYSERDHRIRRLVEPTPQSLPHLRIWSIDDLEAKMGAVLPAVEEQWGPASSWADREPLPE